MGYNAADGLITDIESASLALICSSTVDFTQIYFNVYGPQNTTVQVEEPSSPKIVFDNDSQVYFINTKWEEGYSGPVVVEMTDDETETTCLVSSVEGPEISSCLNNESPRAIRVRPMQFTAKHPGSVLVKPVAHRIRTAC